MDPQREEGDDDGATPEPGFNPLFFGVVAAVLTGVGIGSGAGPSTILHSNLIFRFVVGGVAAAVLYAAVVAVWLAWHRKPFKKVSGPAGTSIEPGDVDATQADQLRQRDREISEFMGTATKALEVIENRLEKLEKREGPAS